MANLKADYTRIHRLFVASARQFFSGNGGYLLEARLPQSVLTAGEQQGTRAWADLIGLNGCWLPALTERLRNCGAEYKSALTGMHSRVFCVIRNGRSLCGRRNSRGAYGSAFFGNQQAQKDCPFAALGLTREASAEELRSRYLKLAKRLHPDAAAGESASSASAFLELRKTYEAALAMHQGAKDEGPSAVARPSSHFSAEPIQVRPPQGSLEAEAQRREWMKDQEALRSFWSGKNAGRLRLQNDADYAAAMASLLKQRLREENEDHKHSSPSSGLFAAGLRNAKKLSATPGALRAAQWERELDDELRVYGLKDGKRNGLDFISSLFPRGSQPEARMWVSRRKVFRLRLAACLAAVAAGITAVGFALLRIPGSQAG
ncbi:hypothetical protein Efla_000894 [Eimeria flavescens]